MTDLILGVKSKEAADALPLERLERGLRILPRLRETRHDLGSKESVLKHVIGGIKEYDRGESEEWHVPF